MHQHHHHEAAKVESHTRIESQQQWEAQYQRHEQLWSGRPNQVLARVAPQLQPGRALDIACGEGGDALWLAQQGWHAIGVDFAATAIERARARAEELGLSDSTEFIAADLMTWHPEAEFNLVTSHYFHASDHIGTLDLLRGVMVPAVAPGGSLLIVGHSAYPSWSAPAKAGITLPGPDEILQRLQLADGEWEVLECDLSPNTVTSPQGQVEDRPDAVVWVRRRGDDLQNY